MMSDSSGALPSPVFHVESDALRFWVRLPDEHTMGASVSRSVLHHRFRGRPDGSDALAIYDANRSEIDAAVARRAAEGSLEPVMVRENDLPAPPR
jgi:hypothetical protein